MARIAHMYYDAGKSMQESRRALDYHALPFPVCSLRRHAEAIVMIKITVPFENEFQLAVQLEETCGLARAVVIGAASLDPAEVALAAGRSGAQWLADSLQDGDVLGVAWGRTVRELVQAFPGGLDIDIDVVQIMGGMRQLSFNFNADDLCKQIAQACGARCHLLFAPAVVNSPEVRLAFLSDSSNRDTVGMFDLVTVALVGIGSMTPFEDSVIYRAGYLKDDEAQRLKSEGAVGDIFGIFYDQQGKISSAQLDQRRIGMTVEQFRRTPRRIAVATGSHKAAAILGAIRAGFVSELITDEHTAQCILDLLPHPAAT